MTTTTHAIPYLLGFFGTLTCVLALALAFTLAFLWGVRDIPVFPERVTIQHVFLKDLVIGFACAASLFAILLGGR